MPLAVEVQTAPGDATDAAAPPPPDEINNTNANSGSSTLNNGPDMIDLQEGTVVGKKKKKSKAFANRGPTALPKRCGTGFEEYYAEPPLTADEFEEEMDLYHASLNFDERIETCIQRYRARRRLDNERSNVFNRYLKVGGIDSNPRMFNGAAGFEEGETMSKDDVRALTATDFVPRAGSKVAKFYAADNAHMWTVDFSGVTSGFLSVSLRTIGGCNEKLMKVGIDVVDNFLRYLQLHDVCPEYAQDVQASRVICEKAKTELPNCLNAMPRMPGQFNLACVKLFCNKPEHRIFDDGLDLLAAIPNKDWDAEHIFRTTVELQDKVIGSKAMQMAKEDINSIHILRTREVELEITRLVRSPKGVRERYAAMAKSVSVSVAETETEAETEVKQPNASADDGDNSNTPKMAGVVITKHYSIEEGIANQPHPTEDELVARGPEAFFLDTDIMDLLCVGTKLRVVMHELNCDINFVSVVKELLPSFYTFLPQELMVDWKEPKPNEREAPSVDNPDAEEDAAEKEMDDDKE
ncbi:hypothetical protein SCUCBS95973_004884 [Sporothrix curviconia]|uniref:Argonaute complex, subunit Arb1 n=1 Tax=Sporothrix curviconia TaxID=1260050 RepID=A0ABP0BSA9_9PEZI